MPDIGYAGEQLLDAWLNLTSTLWNTRLVSSLPYNEAHIMGLLLRHSDKEDPMTATDLIKHTRLLKSQMNKILTRLEERGYITRVRSAQDKRMIHVHLTPEGKAAYLEEHKGVEAILHQLVSKIGTDHALSVARDLFEVVDVLDSIVPPPGR
ncbi:MAG: MarR family winged helix-turn-helix transcriptional regulator [Candidatus Ventricola sp.]